MNFRQSRSLPTLTLASAISAILSSCGGSDPSTASSQQVSGAVADGYIRGAIVCADINANDTCDTDEPSAITGAGGAYTLTIPQTTGNVEIIADIPATAIDEDTNTEVGQAIVFKAPLSRPEFISPITTLVQQARENNPSLDIEEAEATVKGMLGLENDENISLFDDYVNRAEELVVDDSGVNQYRYLHETARVVTSVMKDIESELSAAAQTENIDISTPEVRGAIRDIVRREVSQLLPNISERVSQVVSITEVPSGTIGEGTAPTSQIDAEQLAQELRPTDLAQRVEQKIESALTRPEITPISVENLLNAGMYAIELDCVHDEFELNGPETSQDGDVDSPNELNCVSIYTDIQRDMASGELETVDYQWARGNNNWEIHEESEYEFADFALINGQWVETGDIDPNGPVEFTADGGATITSDFGSIAIKAVSQNLENIAIENHLLETDASHVWFEDTQSDEFATGSIGYRLSIEESPHPYVLFNNPHGLGQSNPDCSEYADNCNIISIYNNEESVVATSLSSIREKSLTGVEVRNNSYASFGTDAPLFILTADATTDGAFPRNGTAIWPVDFSDAAATLTQPRIQSGTQPGTQPGAQADTTAYPCSVVITQDEDDLKIPDLARLVPSDEELQVIIKPENPFLPYWDPSQSPEYPINFPAHDKCEAEGESSLNSAQADLPGTASENLSLSEDTITSTWRIITVDNVLMIEISLPIALRHNSIHDNDTALLLIERNGFVRLGTRLQATDTSTFYTYNSIALEALQQKVIRVLDAH